MSVPLRKEEPEFEENLSTADLAQGKRPVSDDRHSDDHRNEDRPKPVLTRRPTEQNANGTAEAFNQPDAAPLFPGNELNELRNRWGSVQAAFVDEPRSAVEQADGLVASAMKRLAEVFAEERSKLEQQWDRGDNVSTEDLRIALQRYRTFFHRLLSI